MKKATYEKGELTMLNANYSARRVNRAAAYLPAETLLFVIDDTLTLEGNIHVTDGRDSYHIPPYLLRPVQVQK